MKTPLWLMYKEDEYLASKGRKGDTEIRDVAGKKSHVNPKEAKLIDLYGGVGESLVQLIGVGTQNPSTGMPEYHWKGMPWSKHNLKHAAGVGTAGWVEHDGEDDELDGNGPPTKGMWDFNVADYRAAVENGTLDKYWEDLGIPVEDREYFDSALNPEYIGSEGEKGFFEQQADIDTFTAGGLWDAAQDQYRIAGDVAAEGYRAGQVDYTTGMSELAEAYRSGQTAYGIDVNIGQEAWRSGIEDIKIARTEGTALWQAGRDVYDIGMKEMAEGRRAGTEAWEISGEIGQAGFEAGQRAFDIAGMDITEGRRAATAAFDIAGAGMTEGMTAGRAAYDIGGTSIAEALRAGTSAYDIGSAGVAETRRVAEEQYGFGRERGERTQQRSLISLGEAAEAGASRAGFAGGGTGARRAERARGNLWADFGQQQQELEAAKTGALTRADLQQETLESSRVGLEATYGAGGTAQARRASAMAGTTAQYGAGGILQRQRAEAFRAAGAQYGEGGLMDIQRLEAQKAAGALYGGEGYGQSIREAEQSSAWKSITDQYGAEGGGGYFGRQRAENLAISGAQYGQTVDGVFQEGFGGQKLTSGLTALQSLYGEGGGGGTYEATQVNLMTGLQSKYGEEGGAAGGGTYQAGLSNILSGVTAQTGTWADGKYQAGSGGYGVDRLESAWTGTQSKYGERDAMGNIIQNKWGTGGGTYLRGQGVIRDRAQTAYEAAMGTDDMTGSIGLGTEMAESDYYHQAGIDYWDLLMAYEAKQGSDRRLKKNIIHIGHSPSGLKIYNFNYINKEGLYQGVMSDEIPQAAVSQDNLGFDQVDYSMIDVNFQQLLVENNT